MILYYPERERQALVYQNKALSLPLKVVREVVHLTLCGMAFQMLTVHKYYRSYLYV